ncbi:MAG: hypothetical protein PVH88_13335 [Ignavibacteria bacterium]
MKLKLFPKIFLFLSAICLILWLGSYVSRHISIYQFFETKTLNLNKELSESDLTILIRSNASIIYFNLISYLFLILFSFLFALTSKINLRNNGWYFISIVLFVCTIPFEIYLLTFDREIITRVFYSEFTNEDVIYLIIKRIESSSSFIVVELLSFFAIVYMFLFKPFIKKTQ